MTLISEREQDVAQAWGLQGRGGILSRLQGLLGLLSASLAATLSAK